MRPFYSFGSILMYNKFYRYALTLLLLLAGSSSFADTVWMNNGDQLTGEILMLDSGKVLLKTKHAGTVRIDSKQIKTLHSEQSMRVRNDLFGEVITGELQASDEDGYVLLNGHQLELKQLHQAIPDKKLSLQKDLVWSGNITFSADYKRRDSDSDDYDFDIDSKLRHGLWRHNYRLEYDYETKDKQTKTDKLMTSYALDRFMSERWFWQGKYKFNKDRLEDLNRQHSYATGPGFQFWDNELGSLSSAILYNYSELHYQSDGTNRIDSTSLTWDYQRFFFAKTLELFHKGEVSYPSSSNTRYLVDAEMGVRYKINSWFSLSAKAEWDRISSKNNESRNDRRYLIGAGVSW